jgi:hypothetical protein
MARVVHAFLIVTAVVAATFLPFVAGGYDPLAVPLSGMAWMLGRAGLLLVPVGALWLLVSAKRPSSAQPPGWLIGITLCACVLLALVMTLMAFASSGPLLAVGTAVIASLMLIHLRRRLRAVRSEARMPRLAPALLVVAPLVVLAVQSALAGPAATYARNRVIANSAPLIAEIERYHARHGAYPQSTFSIWGDYKPAIRGVERYYYEPTADAYNVIFNLPSLGFGTRRFVAYNPRDKQRVTVHESDRLLLDEAGLDADNAGYTIVEPLPQAHWKAFLFLS